MTMVSSKLSPSLATEILGSLPVGVWLADDNGIIFWANEALGTQLGVPRDALVGRSCEDLPASKALTLYPIGEIYHVAGTALDTDRWLEHIAAGVATAEGRSLRAGCLWDVTHYERARTRRGLILGVQDPVKIDPASGLLNQQALLTALVSEVSRSRRYDNPLAILVIRVWPIIGDAGGDAGGADDEVHEVVKRTAAFLKDRLRWVDIKGRWNRNNIIVVLPETGLPSAQAFVQKLHDEMSRHGLPGSGPHIHVSLGITAWRKGDDAMSLIDRVARQMAADPDPGAYSVAV